MSFNELPFRMGFPSPLSQSLESLVSLEFFIWEETSTHRHPGLWVYESLPLQGIMGPCFLVLPQLCSLAMTQEERTYPITYFSREALLCQRSK